MNLLLIVATNKGCKLVQTSEDDTKPIRNLSITAAAAQYQNSDGSLSLPPAFDPRAVKVEFFRLSDFERTDISEINPLDANAAITTLKSFPSLIAIPGNASASDKKTLGAVARLQAISNPAFTAWIKEALASHPIEVASEQSEGGASEDVFISYSTADRAIAEDLANRFRALRLAVFLAHDTITTGPAWRSQVGVALRRCRVAVLLLSAKSLQSDWVRYEIGAIWALDKPAAPALLDCDIAQLPELVRDYQARSVVEPSDRAVFCHEVARLVGETRTSSK